MTLSQVTVYANQIAKQRLGYQAISLTNYDNDLEPQIAAGSKVEIGGALFEAVSDENISGWAGISNSSHVYIKLIVSGATATAEFTTDAPTWSTSKQGWYDGDDRYIGGLYKDASGNYYNKFLMEEHVGFISGLGFEKNLLADVFTRKKILEIGDWNMVANVFVYVAHGLGSYWKKIRSISAVIRNDTDDVYYNLEQHLSTTAHFQGGVEWVTPTEIRLSRYSGGTFDNLPFDSTSYNRGWIYIEYEA